MKKIICLFIMIFGFLFLTNVNAEEKGIVIKGIEKVNQSDYVEETEPAEITNNEIYLYLKMYSLDDYIQYKVTLENTTDKDLEFNRNDVLMDDDHLNYEFIFDGDSKIIKKNSVVSVTLIVTYKTEVESKNFRNALFYGDGSSNFSLVEYKSITNPLTGNNFMLIISTLFIIIGVFALSIKLKKQVFFTLLLLLIPIIGFAEVSYPVKIHTSLIIGKVKRNPCSYDGNIVQGSEYVNGQYTYKYRQERTSSGWINIAEDGWGVVLTNADATDPINTKMCTSINGKPIVSMSGTYFGSKASSVDLSSVDTSEVVRMGFLFGVMPNLESISLINFDTRKVQNVESMFMYDGNLKEVNMDNLDTSHVVNFSNLFIGCGQLETINFSNLNTSSATNMVNMFSGCSKIETLDLSTWDTIHVTDMGNMFYNCYNLKTIYASDKFNASNASSSYNMFYGCTKLVGGEGSPYNSYYVDRLSARIDEPSQGRPGYFTRKS